MTNILEMALNIKKTKKKDATHFVLCNDGRIRYLIALKGGKKRLISNISSYSEKLSILMKLLNIIPFKLLSIINMGYFATIKFDDEIEKYYKKVTNEIFEDNNSHWNMIVGTYDNKQKLVVQSFIDNKKAIYFKIGNENSNKEMISEINFLSKKKHFSCFNISNMISAQILGKNHKFNIQVTEEFKGEKVEPVLIDDIVKIYQELSKDKKVIDGEEKEFSHGDFAPWNIKKDGQVYIVFDWEHCGYRINGFDLMHYCVVTKVMLQGIDLSKAFDYGMQRIHEFIPDFKIDKEAFIKEYKSLRLE